MKIKIELREGEEIPKGYGIAYVELNRFGAIVYPIPLNFVVGVLHRFYLWVRMGGRLYENGYFKGYSVGSSEGREYAFNQYKEQVKRQEIENIVRNFVRYETKMVKKYHENMDISGWMFDFIDSETKRIKS